MKNTRIVLVSRPTAAPTPDNFRLEEVDMPEIQDGQVLIRNRWLSLDPYMRGRMSEAKSYAPPVGLGEVMIGSGAGEVIASKLAAFPVGTNVVGLFGWQTHAVSDGTQLQAVDTRSIPLQAYLGAVGMPGVTAWIGVNDICAPKADETLVVTAASGAVGSVVGQLAKQRGARAIGIAGGPEKCAYVVNELGFDACIDYKAGNLAAELKAATPKGIDCVFENVGGEIFDTLLTRMNPFSRIAICGLIAQYNGAPYPMQNFGSVLVNRITVQGFIVSEHLARWPAALQELGAMVVSGRLKYRETVAQGLAAAPAAFIGLLKGQNFGKQLVKLD
jgi:NADPH-dependent curcumin reductase CurA